MGCRAGRDTSGDFAVKRIDGKPAIWIKALAWGALTYTAALRDYHLRHEFE